MQESVATKNTGSPRDSSALRRWLYRGGRPGWIAKIANGLLARMISSGRSSDLYVALEVPGRKTGRKTTFPLVPVTVDGQRYLVSMLGDNAQWVKNVRAASGRAVIRKGTRDDILLEEVPIDRRAPLIKAYLQVAFGARAHVPVNKDAPISEFEKIAPAYPVFRVIGDRSQEISRPGAG